MVRKYKKKPVVIEAVQWDGLNIAEIAEFMHRGTENPIRVSYKKPESPIIKIETLEGIMEASVGDFIIRGINGEFYPCKPDIFDKTYDMINNFAVGETKAAFLYDGE